MMKPAYYFTFANPHGDLSFLAQEQKAIDSIFKQRLKTGEGEFVFWKNEKTNPDDLDTTFDTFDESLVLFHFSGHADRDRLVLSGANAFSKGISHQLKFLLEKQNNDRAAGKSVQKFMLVFLNGCSTVGQVGALHEVGVPVVIGTSGSISDELAALFAEKFYYAFVLLECTIEKAFEYAKGIVVTRNHEMKIHRSINGFANDEENEEMPFWGISYKEDESFWLNKKLPVFQNNRPVDAEVNKYLIKRLCNSLAEVPVMQVVAVRERYNRGERTKEWQNDLVLSLYSAYPSIISNELRRLLSTSQQNELLNLGEPRLLQLSKTFQTAAELLFFISFSQLYSANLKLAMAERTSNGFPEKDRDKIYLLKNYFTTTKKGRTFFDFIPLIKATRLLFDDCLKQQAAFYNERGINTIESRLGYFMTEQEDLSKEMEQDHAEFPTAVHFFRELCNIFEKELLNSKDDMAVSYLCREAEKQLAVVLSRLAFSARYDLVSIKNVELYLPRHKVHPLYILKIPIAEEIDDWFDSGNRPSPPRLSNPVHPRAVLLAKDDALLTDGVVRELTDNNQINLSPFLIDLSIIAGEKAKFSTVDLYIFSHFEKYGDDYHYHYTQSINLDKEVIIDSRHPAHADIHEPFQDMLQKLFHQSFDDL